MLGSSFMDALDSLHVDMQDRNEEILPIGHLNLQTTSPTTRRLLCQGIPTN